MTMKPRRLIGRSFLWQRPMLATLAAATASDAPVIRTRADGLLDVTPPSSPGPIVRYTLDGS